jgi:peptide/nickel transport system permease protein
MTAQGTAIRRAMARPVAWISLLWLLLITLVCASAGVLAPVDPLAQNISRTLAGPSAAHWLGTDDLGRDLLSRLLYGGGGLLAIALIPVAVSLAIGVPAGLAAGYIRGGIDTAASFVVDVMFALPGLVVVLAVAAVTNNNLIVMTLVFGVLTSGGIFRVVRSATAAARDMPYVDAALVARLPRRRILARHVLPNLAGPLIVQAFVQYSGTFLFMTALSFLGLGFSPETPSWGQLTLTATQNLYQDPWMMVPVGFVLISTVLALNMVGFALLQGLTGYRRPSLIPLGRVARRNVLPTRSADVVRPVIAPREPGMPVAADVVLAVEDLQVTFPGADRIARPVVDGVSLSLRRGEAFGLVGESGSGKTTTALAVLGLVPPPGRITSGRITSGRILLDGQDLLQIGVARLRSVRGSKLGLVSQEPMVALDPCFTVGSQLRELLRLRRDLPSRSVAATALELLHDVGLPVPDVVAGRYPHQLSGGIAQRVSIAMALSREPQVLLADEPTTALDVTVQAEILDLLRRLQQERSMALLLVTHDLGIVADLCDRVAVMSEGKLVEVGTAEDVLVHPQHPYSRKLINATPKLDIGDHDAAAPGPIEGISL